MSVAICLACGAFKSNAFLPCESCGVRPRGLDALARLLLVTDHFFAAWVDGTEHLRVY